MDLPVAIVDVDCVLEEAGQIGQAHRVGGVEPRLEVGEIALHLRPQAVPPPVGKITAVHG